MGTSMEESNKVVVKVKYQGLNQDQKTNSRPDMVTEWHIPRILGAIAILVIFILFPFYYFSDQPSEAIVDHKTITKIADTKNIKSTSKVTKTVNQKIPATVIAEKVNNSIKQEVLESKIPKAVIKSNIKQATSVTSKKPEQQTKIELATEQSKTKKTIPPNTHIVRALLTTGLNNKEPVDNIVSEIKVSKQKAAGIYYFTEINNMKGQALYHHWLRAGKLIYKRKIRILGNRWRAATSKLITYSKTGDWAVRLVNEQGITLNEIQFKAVKE